MVADLTTVGAPDRSGLRRRLKQRDSTAWDSTEYQELRLESDTSTTRLQTATERQMVVQTPQAALRHIGGSANVHMPASRARTAPAMGRTANMSADASIGAGAMHLVSATEAKRLAAKALRQVRTAEHGNRDQAQGEPPSSSRPGSAASQTGLDGIGTPSILLDAPGVATDGLEPAGDEILGVLGGENRVDPESVAVSGFIAGRSLEQAASLASMPRAPVVPWSAAGRARGDVPIKPFGELALAPSGGGMKERGVASSTTSNRVESSALYAGFRVGTGAAIGASAPLPRSAIGTPPEVLLLRWRERTAMAVLWHRMRYIFLASFCYPVANQLQLRHEIGAARASGRHAIRCQSPRRPALTLEDDVQPAAHKHDMHPVVAAVPPLDLGKAAGAAGAAAGSHSRLAPDDGSAADLRSTANLHDLDQRSGEAVSGAALCCAGPEWQEGHVTYRTWVGSYTFTDLRHSPHVSAGGDALYHGEWSEVGAAQGHPHGRGYVHFLSDHPRFNPDFNRWPEYYERLRHARDRLLATRADRPYGELFTGAKPDTEVRSKMARLIARDEAMSIAIAAQAEAVTVGAEPRALALDAVASLARRLEAAARRDRRQLERAAKRGHEQPSHVRGRRLEAAIQREQEARARRLEWLRLRDYARRQQYLEAVRRADEIARAAIGDNPQLLRDAWGAGGGASPQAAVRRAYSQDLDDVPTPRPESAAQEHQA